MQAALGKLYKACGGEERVVSATMATFLASGLAHEAAWTGLNYAIDGSIKRAGVATVLFTAQGAHVALRKKIRQLKAKRILQNENLENILDKEIGASKTEKNIEQSRMKKAAKQALAEQNIKRENSFIPPLARTAAVWAYVYASLTICNDMMGAFWNYVQN